VAEDDRRRAAAAPVLEPGREGRGRRRVVVLGALALRGAVPHADGEVAVVSGIQGIADPEHVGGIVPARVEARVHEPDVAQVAEERPPGEPVQEDLAVGRFQHVLERVPCAHRSSAARGAQEMHVVVAEHAARVERAHQAQRAGRVGPAVDEVADRLQPVRGRIEAQELQEPLQLDAAALDVAHEDAAGHQDSAILSWLTQSFASSDAP
jgi:hypothetical protein